MLCSPSWQIWILFYVKIGKPQIFYAGLHRTFPGNGPLSPDRSLSYMGKNWIRLVRSHGIKSRHLMQAWLKSVCTTLRLKMIRAKESQFCVASRIVVIFKTLNYRASPSRQLYLFKPYIFEWAISNIIAYLFKHIFSLNFNFQRKCKTRILSIINCCYYDRSRTTLLCNDTYPSGGTNSPTNTDVCYALKLCFYVNAGRNLTRRAIWERRRQR